jgi:hypothetical protein
MTLLEMLFLAAACVLVILPHIPWRRVNKRSKWDGRYP